MRIKTLTVLFLMAWTQTATAQDAKQKAKDDGLRAVKLADKGQLDEAITILAQCYKMDPETMEYMYELAYCHYLKKEYTKAVKCLSEVMHHKKVNDRCYQMLGNVYDDMGDSVNALATYKAGLEKFPNSGSLYLETGNYYNLKKDYHTALQNYELGITKDPMHPSNYFRAAEIFLTRTEEEVWGMMYGEIFMNLEPATDRTKVMSKWLYDTYKSEIKIENDTAASVSFSKTAVMDPRSKILPFNTEYEMGFLMNMHGIKTMDLESMCSLRTSFIKTFFEQNKYKDHAVCMLDYNYKVMKAGHLDAYNHWLLSNGDKEAFKKWVVSHAKEFDSFAEWFKVNGIQLNTRNVFVRAKFGG